MIKNSPISSLYVDNLLERDSFIQQLFAPQDFEDKVIDNSNSLRDASEFTSLERISIVIDGLLGDISEKEICFREKISEKDYAEWKADFLEAFNKYSEIEIFEKAISSKNKTIILEELGSKVYDYYRSFTNVASSNNLVISKGKLLSNFSNFTKINNLIFLEKINNFRLINKQLENINAKMPFGGILMGNFETFTDKAERKSIYKTPFKNLYLGYEFIINRVLPKLPYIKKAYFFITKGQNRQLSKTEALGRLVSCGFDINDVRKIDGVHYFVAKKVKEPAFDMNPSYGPVFKMRRVGKDGKIIKCYKLRTMHPYSEYLQEYVYNLNGSANGDKINNDFRVTSWGKVARKLWLDELPMLINLIKGDIKLIGVRPLSKTKYDMYTEELKELRIKAKPGLLPPFYADMPTSFEGLMESEKNYLQQYLKAPRATDIKYLLKILNNILVKGHRSA